MKPKSHDPQDDDSAEVEAAEPENLEGETAEAGKTAEEVSGTPPPVRLLVAARAARAAAARRRPASPAELAARLIPGYRVTPTIRLISDVLADAITQPGRRVICTTPPRTGKSRLISQVGTIFALMLDPDSSVILTSYSDDLAREHSHEARRLINDNVDLLGYQLSPDKTAVGRRKVDGRFGGLLATGIQSGVTGFGADLLLIDDPVKDAAEADSAAHRRRIMTEFRSTLVTRLHPNASCVLVMTRWHPEDLAGILLADEPDVWRHINIPAVAEAGVPDALGREPGAVMTSALGYTAAHFTAMRRTSGERAWFALYEGVPAAPEGGLIKREWLDQWRLPAAPQRPIYTVIGVDPSDSGSGDSCGLVAASMTADGVVSVIADQSAPMTSDQWAREAVELAVAVGASEIAVEAFSAGTTYSRVVREALGRYKIDRPIRVTAWPPKGSGRGSGDAVARSAALLQALEVGTCRLAGFLPDLEQAAVVWQAGQHQPDSLAALVVAFDVLVHMAGQPCVVVSPLDVARRAREGKLAPLPEWLNRRAGGRRSDLTSLENPLNCRSCR